MDNPSDAAHGFPPHAPPFQEDISLIAREVEALVVANTLLSARLDAVEFNLDQLLSYTGESLSPQQLVEAIRQLRQEIQP